MAIRNENIVDDNDLGLIIVKPDAVSTAAEIDIRSLLSLYSLHILKESTIELSPQQIECAYPLDARLRPFEAMLHLVIFSNRQVRVLVCEGSHAIESCLEIKQIIRDSWVHRAYANIIHTPDTGEDLRFFLEALRKHQGYSNDMLSRLPERWCGWSRQEIYDGAWRVWGKAIGIGRDSSVRWTPPCRANRLWRISAQSFTGTLDEMIISLKGLLGLHDVENTLRSTLAALYDPCGVGFLDELTPSVVRKVHAYGFLLIRCRKHCEHS